MTPIKVVINAFGEALDPARDEFILEAGADCNSKNHGMDL